MLQTLAAVPLVEPFEQEGLQFERVVCRWIWDAHHFCENEEHEQVIFVALRSGEGTTIRRYVEFLKQRLESRECATGIRHEEKR